MALPSVPSKEWQLSDEESDEEDLDFALPFSRRGEPSGAHSSDDYGSSEEEEEGEPEAAAKSEPQSRAAFALTGARELSASGLLASGASSCLAARRQPLACSVGSSHSLLT
jgi:hypothetical protein